MNKTYINHAHILLFTAYLDSIHRILERIFEHNFKPYIKHSINIIVAYVNVFFILVNLFLQSGFLYTKNVKETKDKKVEELSKLIQDKQELEQKMANPRDLNQKAWQIEDKQEELQLLDDLSEMSDNNNNPDLKYNLSEKRDNLIRERQVLEDDFEENKGRLYAIDTELNAVNKLDEREYPEDVGMYDTDSDTSLDQEYSDNPPEAGPDYSPSDDDPGEGSSNIKKKDKKTTGNDVFDETTISDIYELGGYD